MQIVDFRPDLLPSLTRLINTQMASIPPGWTFSETQVQYTIEGAASLWGMHFLDDRESYTAPAVCVLQRREVVAAAQWLIPAHSRNVCSLGWIVADPKHPMALQTLLHLLEKQATTEGFQLIDCSRFSFGTGWFGIPTGWTHVVEGMKTAGFEQAETWMLMHGGIDVPETPPAPLPDIKFFWNMNRPALEWTLSAYNQDVSIGECQIWGIPDHFEGSKGFGEWATVEWLEVADAYQRQGLGTRLMLEQMRFHARRGIQQLMMWVREENSSAHALNESLGFTYGPALAVMQKRLSWL